ncbi:recombinase RarA, partial [Aliarcobacter butzleri]
RSFLYEFKAFDYKDMLKIFDIALKDIDINISSEAKEYLIQSSSGDARAMLTLLNFSYKVSKDIDLNLLKELRERVIGDG